MENIEIAIDEFLPFGPIEIASQGNVSLATANSHRNHRNDYKWSIIIGVVVIGGIIYAIYNEGKKQKLEKAKQR